MKAITFILLSALCVFVIATPRKTKERLGGKKEDAEANDRPDATVAAALATAKGRCMKVVWREGEIASPLVRGKYPKTYNCLWKIIAPPGRKIRLEFTIFKVQNHKTCSADYVALYNGPNAASPLVGTFCGVDSSDTFYPDGAILSTNRFLLLRFRTDKRIEHRGWKARVTFIERGSPYSSTPTQLRPNSVLKYPPTGGYGNNAECRWLVQAPRGSYVRFKLTTIDIEESDNCLYDFLEVHDGDNPNAVAIGNRFCGRLDDSVGPNSIRTSSGNSMFIVFKSDKSVVGEGFKAEFSVVRTPGVPLCPGNPVRLSGSGTLTFPTNGGLYVNQMSCEWLFTAQQGQTIEITVTKLDIEFDTACQYDALNIYDSGSPSSSPKYSLCGDEVPTTKFVSSSNKMFMRFFSDHSVVHTGFVLDFKTIDGDTDEDPGDVPVYGCSDEAQTIAPAGGIIQVPLRGSEYKNNMNCMWTIYAPEGLVIRAKFLFMDIIPSPRCTGDRVDIANGEQLKLSSLIDRVCGMGAPAKEFVSDGNVMTVRFFSNRVGVAGGFKLVLQPGLKLADCGSPMISRSSGRIIGGQIAKPHTWPWQVSLRYRLGGGHFCGGSIVNKHWIVTAAHCVGPRDVRGVLVVAGAHKKQFSGSGETKRQVKTVSRIIRYPRYTQLRTAPDVALVRLSSPLDLDPQSTEGTAHPVCLPPPGVAVPDYKSCFTTGWGVTRNQARENFLNEVEVPIVPQAVCGSNGYYGDPIKSFEVCAGFQEGGKDSCQGDSGGPLVCFINGKYELHGITSWGIGCAVAKKPGVYTRVSEISNWIKRIVNNN